MEKSFGELRYFLLVCLKEIIFYEKKYNNVSMSWAKIYYPPTRDFFE